MRVADAADVAGEAAEPGRVIVENGRMIAACAQGTWLELIEVQPEGKRRMGAAEFLHGYVKIE